jgi:hypothetical protein
MTEAITTAMNRRALIKRYGIWFIMAIIVLPGCSKSSTREPGFLEGIISIGPICPVEKIPPDPACQPTAETYKAYPVSVYSSDGKKKIIQLNPSLDGSYNCELSPGNYLVKLDKAQNGIGGSNLPAEVTITSRYNTVLSISIDTGIR